MTETPITIEFGGGAESLFGDKKKHQVTLNADKKWTIESLLQWMKENLLTGKEDLFLQNDTIRPGILILVNDADWELLGELQYELQPKDNVMFISTLHGG